jgi:hypothetical protein
MRSTNTVTSPLLVLGGSLAPRVVASSSPSTDRLRSRRFLDHGHDYHACGLTRPNRMRSQGGWR